MKRVVVATRNAGKVREFARALGEAGIEACGLEVLDDAGAGEVEETGDTFEANARLKAEDYSSRTDLPVLADDSGLEVDALGRRPGVQSARYGGPDVDDDGRNRLLLRELAATAREPARRTARFRCALAVARHGRTVAVFEGAVEGRIAAEPAGDGGFGYDPVFYHPESGCTFGLLTPAAKQRVSHRGRAIAALLEALRGGDPRLADLR